MFLSTRSKSHPNASGLRRWCLISYLELISWLSSASIPTASTLTAAWSHHKSPQNVSLPKSSFSWYHANFITIQAIEISEIQTTTRTVWCLLPLLATPNSTISRGILTYWSWRGRYRDWTRFEALIHQYGYVIVLFSLTMSLLMPPLKASLYGVASWTSFFQTVQETEEGVAHILVSNPWKTRLMIEVSHSPCSSQWWESIYTTLTRNKNFWRRSSVSMRMIRAW